MPAETRPGNGSKIAKMTRQHESMWRAFIEAHSAVMRVLEQDMMEKHGLALSWYDVLLHLAEAPEGRLRLGELANSVILTKSGITRLIDRMVDAGMVVREACPGDRRGYYAVITQSGRDTIEKVGPGHSQKAWEVFLSQVSPEEAAVLHRVFRRVLGLQPKK